MSSKLRVPLAFIVLTLVCTAQTIRPFRSDAASGPEEPLVLLVSVSPERPSIDAAFTVSILVDHPNPEEVSSRAPALPPNLALDRTRIEPRRIRGTSDREERWSAVEYTFTVTSAEDFELGPFEVSVPGKQARTSAMTIRVGGSNRRLVAPSLGWLNVPPSLRAGESVEVLLVMNGGQLPADAAISAAAPEDALLEIVPLAEADREKNAVARLRLTALSPPALRLPAVTVGQGEAALRAPSGSIRVHPGSSPASNPTESGDAVSVPASEVGSSERRGPAATPRFPDSPSFPLPLRSSAEGIVSLARSAWSAGDYARSLAFLRAAERGSVAGFALSGVRKEAEKALGLGITPTEHYAPTALIFLALLCCLASGTAFFFSRGVTSGGRRGYKIAILFVVLAGLSIGRLVVVRLDAAGYLGRGASAISSSCTAYRIPEVGGGASAEFAEGEVIRLRSAAGTWIYAESDDGRAGWVEIGRVIRY